MDKLVSIILRGRAPSDKYNESKERDEWLKVRKHSRGEGS